MFCGWPNSHIKRFDIRCTCGSIKSGSGNGRTICIELQEDAKNENGKGNIN